MFIIALFILCFLLTALFVTARRTRPVETKPVEPVFITRQREVVQVEELGQDEDHLRMARMFKNEKRDGLQALHHYIVAFQEHGYEDAVIEVAELYSYGLHPSVPPEKILAGRIFNYICHSQQFSQRSKDYAKYVLHNIAPLMYDDTDRSVGSHSCFLPSNIVEILTSVEPDTLICTEQHAPLVVTEDENDAIIVITPPIVSDSQNVHDSELQNAAKKNIDVLYSSDDESDPRLVMNTIYQTHPKLSPDDKLNISLVLDSINDTNTHSKYGKTEMQILNAIWGRINSPVNNKNKDELVLSLADQLSSAVEHGAVVCSTGKIMRIVSSLEAIDLGNDITPLKPKWAIEREISEAAIKARSSVLSSQPKHVVSAYNTGESEGEHLACKMRDILEKKCYADYVKTGIIDSEAALKLILQPFLDSF
jgi:hypothetical protein